MSHRIASQHRGSEKRFCLSVPKKRCWYSGQTRVFLCSWRTHKGAHEAMAIVAGKTKVQKPPSAPSRRWLHVRRSESAPVLHSLHSPPTCCRSSQYSSVSSIIRRLSHNTIRGHHLTSHQVLSEIRNKLSSRIFSLHLSIYTPLQRTSAMVFL